MSTLLGGGGTPSGIQAVIAIVTLLLSGTSVIGLIRVWPERRKINAETVTEGANAASLLTAQAMAMVKEAREAADSRLAEMRVEYDRRTAEIEARLTQAEERMRSAEARAREEEAANRVCEEENLSYAREIGRLVRRLAQWEDWVTEGREPPTHRGDHDGAH